MGCLETLWDYAHCIPEGDAYPTKISNSEVARHNLMDLRYEEVFVYERNDLESFLAFSEIIDEFNGTKSSADVANITNQLRCFGLGKALFLLYRCSIKCVTAHLRILTYLQNILLVVILTMEATQILVLSQFGKWSDACLKGQSILWNWL